MAHPWHHAISSSKTFGGTPEEHFPLHAFLDHSKMILADPRHRSLLHHHAGIDLAKTAFAHLQNAEAIATLHITEDMGRIPQISDWILPISPCLKEGVLKNSRARATNFEESLKGNPFPADAQRGLQKILDILSTPEKREPNLAESPLRLFYFTAAGIFLCEDLLGPLLPNSQTATRYAAEWIVRNTIAKIPSFQDILQGVPIEDWMYKKAAPVV